MRNGVSDMKQQQRQKLGALPLPAGERVGVRGFENRRGTATPHPIPLPMGEGAHRVCRQVFNSKQSQRWRRALVLAVAVAVALGPTLAPAQDKAIVVASTTSTQDSGLFGHIL